MHKKIPVLTWPVFTTIAVITLLTVTIFSSFTESISERENRAILYTRMISESISRTIESVDTTLVSLSEDTFFPTLSTPNLYLLRQNVKKALRFSPHIRQIVLTQERKVILDSRGASHSGSKVDFSSLGLFDLPENRLFHGIQVGKQVHSRFLPLENHHKQTGSRSLIPLALTFTTKAGQTYTLIAGLNASYLNQILLDLQLHSEEHVGLYGFDGNELLASSPGYFQQQTNREIQDLINQGKDFTQIKLKDSLLDMGQYIVVQILDKYPISVVLSINHSRTFLIWLGKNKYLLLGLFLTTILIIVSTIIISLEYTTMRALQNKVSSLTTAIQQSSVSVLITDLAGNIEYVNNHFETTTGYTLEEVVGKNPRFLKSGLTSDEVYSLLWETITRGEIWQGELTNRSKNDTLFCARVSIAPVTNNDGEITRYIAVAEDITQQKKNEKELRLAAAVFNNSTEAIVVTDRENRIQSVNQAFEKITGYDRSLVIGETPAILRSGQHDDLFYQNMYDALKTQGRWEGEIYNRKRNGEIYPEWLTIFTLLDSNDQLDGYAAMFLDITKRKQAEAYILRQANFDSLTGLVNRNFFNERLSHALDHAVRTDEQIAILFMDLDRFKHINDTLGHSAGDQLLQEVSKRLLKAVRKSDTVARFGGDEFALILQNIKNLKTLEFMVVEILNDLSKSYLLQDRESFISASIGVTLYPEDGNDPETLLRNADSAMYRAKAKGRNDYQFFTQSMSDEINRHKDMENALHHALKNDEFTIYYQPIKDLENNKITHAEALIRWNHPEKGLISPNDFIPLAEEVGLISNIGEWVLHNACMEAVSWSKIIDSPPGVTVNLSVQQFDRYDIPKLVSSILEKTGLSAKKLTLEITESILLADTDAIKKQLIELRDMGVQISIDDFGTGYSSLSYLKKFPVNNLKIDRSFIAELSTNAEDKVLVTAIIAMAHSLNLKIIAEGVDTRTQEAYLISKNCKHAQGYLYSKPLIRTEFIEKIKSGFFD
jgi:diguanylate cyclase (GGDEF)-like protein/PAS domain S-box-containing protein